MDSSKFAIHQKMEQNSGVELKSFTYLATDIKAEIDKTLEVTDSDEVILKPGLKIKPQVCEKEAVRLAERLYGISTKEIMELISYDDRNFLIHVDTNIKNPIIPNAWPHGYVLKIINTLDTEKVKSFDGQTQVMLFLRQQGIECPKPVMNIFGKYHSTEKIGDSLHLIRLLEFIPGKVFHQVLKTNYLFYQVGEFTAKIDVALKRFSHDAYINHKSIWMLESVPKLTKFLYAVSDEKKQALVQSVIDAFNEKVISQWDHFARGIIHGDVNEQNIVVNKAAPDSEEFRVAGIIDFGDMCHSLYVSELAIAIAYMLLQSDELETAGYFIAGYQEVRLIPENERKVLKICVTARLCQSLVLGAYSHTLDPENDYVLTTQASGWPLLEKIWSSPNNMLEELWFSTADNYVKQSIK